MLRSNIKRFLTYDVYSQLDLTIVHNFIIYYSDIHESKILHAAGIDLTYHGHYFDLLYLTNRQLDWNYLPELQMLH